MGTDAERRWRLWLLAHRYAALIRTHPSEVWFTYLAAVVPWAAPRRSVSVRVQAIDHLSPALERFGAAVAARNRPAARVDYDTWRERHLNRWRQ